MGEKLTEARRVALGYIVENPRKSGRFWRDLGVAPSVIAGLENDGLVGAPYHAMTGETTILRRSWVATDAGRAALQESK